MTEPAIEDITTPEPGAGHRRWELLAGLLLLLAVLGAGGSGWWQGKAANRAYRDGVAAEQQHQWGAAGVAFRAAGAWRDAPARAAKATTQQTQLTALSAEGESAVARGAWPAAFRAFTAATAIAPAGSALGARAAAARAQLLATGLAGLVVSVTGGAPPGLYLEPGGQYLPGSDAASRVRAVAPDGRRFVYDTPPPGAAADPTSAPRSDFWIPSHAALQVRPSTLVTLDAAGTAQLTPLPAAVDGNGLGLFLGEVLWWYTPRDDFGYYSYAVTFFDLRTGEHGRIADSSGRLEPIAWTADGRRVALAVYESVPAGAPPHARISLADAHGRRLTERDLGAIDGTIEASGFSDDGRFLFCQAVGRGSTEHSLYLADLTASGAEGPLLQPVESLVVPDATAAGLTAAWLGAGDTLLVDSWTGGIERLETYDAAGHLAPDGTIASWGSLWQGPAHPPLIDRAAISEDGRQIAWRGRQADGQAVLIRLAPGGPAEQTPLALGADRALEIAFAPHGDYLVYSGHTLDDSAAGRLGPVFAVPASGPGPPVRVGERTWDVERPSLALPAAGTLVALVTPQHELHAVTYDGATDLLVAGDAAAVWDLHAAASRGWMH